MSGDSQKITQDVLRENNQEYPGGTVTVYSKLFPRELEMI